VTGNGAFVRAMGWIPGCIYLGLAIRLALDARR
jgi:hypothetical protein